MIYKHKADQALTMEKFYLQSDFVPLSLAWGNGSLWSVGQDGTVRRHDPQTLAVGDTYRFADYKEKVIDLLARDRADLLQQLEGRQLLKGGRELLLQLQRQGK